MRGGSDHSGIPEVVLELLGTRYVVRSRHREWVEVVELLWRPFVVASNGTEGNVLEVDWRAQGWLLTNFADAPVMNEDPWLVLHQIRNLTSQHALSMATGVVGLHGSVAANRDVALILSGRAEAGKTTLGLELLERGWAYVSDDLAPLDASTGKVLSFPKPLQVRERARWEAFRHRWHPPRWLPPPQAGALLPGHAFRTVNDSVSASALVFPTFAPGSEPTSRELSPGLAAARCCENLQNPHLPLESALPYFASLCERVPAAEITYPSTNEAINLLQTLFTNWGLLDMLTLGKGQRHKGGH